MAVEAVACALGSRGSRCEDDPRRPAAADTTPRPPFSAPEWPELRFVRDLRALWEEGERMEHCAFDLFASNALAGDRFFFHFTDDGEEATTIMTDRHGNVVEAQGKGNSKNGATCFVREIGDPHRRRPT